MKRLLLLPLLLLATFPVWTAPDAVGADEKAVLLDVSSHQGSINWKKVSQSRIGGVYHKISEGEDFRDPNWSLLRGEILNKRGIPWGLYHFLRPRQRSADREARWFSRQSAGNWGRLLPAIDIETTALPPKETGNYLADFIRSMRKRGVPRMLLYASPGWWKSHVMLTERLKRELPFVRAWIAHWGVRTPKPLAGIRGWSLHQYSSKGTIEGIRGHVDMNRTRDFSLLLRKSE